MVLNSGNPVFICLTTNTRVTYKRVAVFSIIRIILTKWHVDSNGIKIKEITDRKKLIKFYLIR